MRLKLLKVFALVLVAAMVFVGAPGFGSSADASVLIKINKVTQRMTVIVDGKQRYNWKVSTGKMGYGTPSGTYKPFRMEPDHFSKEWDDAPMPHSIFFTGRGHAIHGSYATKRLGSPASHGCVRLAPGNAATLYSLVSRQGMGKTTITITGGGLALTDEFAPVSRQVKKARKKFGDWLER